METAHQMRRTSLSCEFVYTTVSFGWAQSGVFIKLSYRMSSVLSARFFMEQNNRIFQTLSEVAASADPTLTAEHVRAMGLDPQADRTFLVDLLELYGIDAMLVIDNPCCP